MIDYINLLRPRGKTIKEVEKLSKKNKISGAYDYTYFLRNPISKG